MPRTKEAGDIRAWRMESHIKDMAEGSKTDAVMATEYDVEEQSIRVFRMRHKADIQAKKQEWATEYGHIWSTRQENRLRV